MKLSKQSILVISTVGLSLLITGCATAPEETAAPTIEAPAQWTNTTSLDAPADWLSDFNSPELRALITEAINNNPNLEATAARLTQAGAEARIAGADLLPSAGLGLDGNRQQISTFGPTSTGGVIFENYNLALNLSWEIDLWGRLRDRKSAALAQVTASQADYQAAKLSLAAQTAKAWFNLIEAQQQLNFAQNTAEAYNKNLQALESRFKRGLSEGLDLRRMRTQAASAQSDVAARERALDQASRSLEILLGRYPSAEQIAASQLPNLPPEIPAGVPAQILERRPDLIAAERRLAATEKERSASHKDRLPQISLTASGGTSSQNFENLLDGDFAVWSLAANLAQPIFQGGRLIAAVNRAESIRDQAAANYRDIALSAFYEVETTLAAESFLRKEITNTEVAANEAIKAEELAWQRYREGTGDFLTALDSQRTTDAAQGRLITIRSSLLKNRIDLYLALGGSISESL